MDTDLRPRVGVQALIVRQDHLLTVKKMYSSGEVYILPGGSQNHGETLAEAVVRECEEEIGTTVEVRDLLFVREYIGAHHEHASEDADLHLVNLVFACGVPAGYEAATGPFPDPDQTDVVWLPVSDLDSYRVLPSMLKELLPRLDQTAVYLGDVN